MTALPDRLNLSIGNSCWVRCPGCYSMFGRTSPTLARFESSVACFAHHGIRAVTVSGGDPLRVPGILSFLRRLRGLGIESVKVDTVGTAFLPGSPTHVDLDDLLGAVDILGVPLDGWSEESVAWFRQGRRRLFAETVELIGSIRAARTDCQLYVNTVLHRRNLSGIGRIFDIVAGVDVVRRWNVFQYMPTDQAPLNVNESLAVSDSSFRAAQREVGIMAVGVHAPEIEFATPRDRLGRYLLINSDGDGWIPDAEGRTVPLGNTFGREYETLRAWREAAARVISLAQPAVPQERTFAR